ncbi:MAG TPA: hypothetical protein VHB79_32550 [Polyangiaceae bacterium]|nr:hypothetical protein [Polyangiaceae bacterium]
MWLLVACGCVAMLTVGCGVDDRPLSQGSAEIPVCVYDEAVGPGCDTLVANPGFEKGISGWKPDMGVLSNWVADDAYASDRSGAIRVLNLLQDSADDLLPGAAAQCVAVSAGASYDMAGDIFIPEGQHSIQADEASAVGAAGLSLLFFPDAACADESIGSVDSDMADHAGTWTHVTGTGEAPPETRAVQIRLGTLPAESKRFEALFDNILLRAR